MRMSNQPEIVIVGGGIGGGALATVLARAGLSVGVLERDLDPVDRVRGEFMAPWGVAEAARLGLLEKLSCTGGVFATRAIYYDENKSAEQAEATPHDMRAVHPIGTGALCAGILRCALLSAKRPSPKGQACCAASRTLPSAPGSHPPSNSSKMATGESGTLV